jgi:hypothetical protein
MAKEFLLRRLQESNQLFANTAPWASNHEDECCPLDFSVTSRTFPREEEPLSLVTRKLSGDEARSSPDSGIFSPSFFPLTSQGQQLTSQHQNITRDVFSGHQTVYVPMTGEPGDERTRFHRSDVTEVRETSLPETNNGKPKSNNKSKKSNKSAGPKRLKAARKTPFDEYKSSPVSGTVIMEMADEDELTTVVCEGDIDPAFNIVNVTEEARAELALIDNRIGDYVCRLCKVRPANHQCQ